MEVEVVEVDDVLEVVVVEVEVEIDDVLEVEVVEVEVVVVVVVEVVVEGAEQFFSPEKKDLFGVQVWMRKHTSLLVLPSR